MKKRLNKILFLVFLITLLLNFVSANGYSDNTYIPNSVYCSDTDRGVYSTIKGTISVGGKKYTDSCYNNNKTVYEYYCSGNNYGTSYINCPLGFSCSNGVCVSVPVVEKLNINIATLKDTYKVGEAIELTDPPYDVEPSVTGDALDKNKVSIETNNEKFEQNNKESILDKIIKFFGGKITGQAGFSFFKSKCKKYSDLFYDKDKINDPSVLTDKINEAAVSICTEEKSKFSSNLKSLLKQRKDLLLKKLEKKEVCSVLKVKTLNEKALSTLTSTDKEDLIEQKGSFIGYVDVIHIDDFEHPENTDYKYYIREGAKSREISNKERLSLSYANSKVKMKGTAIANKMILGDELSNGCNYDYGERSVQVQGGVTGKVVEDASTSSSEVEIISQPKRPVDENIGPQRTLVIIANIGDKKAPVTVEEAKEMFSHHEQFELNFELTENQEKIVKFNNVEYSFIFNIETTSGINVKINGVSFYFSNKQNYRLFKGYDIRLDYYIPKINGQTAKSGFSLIARDNIVDFYRENSYNKVSFITDILGPYDVSLSKIGCYPSEILDEAFKRSDIKEFNYDRLIFEVPCLSGCPCVGGVGTIGKLKEYILPSGEKRNFSFSSVFRSGSSVVKHELGHNFGVNHANYYICYDENNNEEIFPSYNCINFEYGDEYDIMGSSFQSTFNAPHKLESGWLPPENSKEVNEGRYFLKPINMVQPLGTLQQLRIPISYEGNFYFDKMDYLYYSISLKSISKYDFLNGKDEMVFIHLAKLSENGKFSLIQTTLLPLSSNEGSFNYNLKVGKTFIDKMNGVSITLNTLDKNGAEIIIRKIPIIVSDIEKPILQYDFTNINKDKKIVRDISGYGSYGIIKGDPKQLGGGMYFNGNKDSLEFKSFTNYLILKNNAFSVTQWINSKDLTRWGIIYSSPFTRIIQNSMNFEFLTYFENTNFENTNFEKVKYYKNYVVNIYDSNLKIKAGQWYYIALVYNGRELILYINGEEKARITSGELGSFDGTKTVEHPLVKLYPIGSYSIIGGDKISEGYDFNGIIDEFKIYGRALSFEEIKKEYETFKPEPFNYQSKLVNSGTTDVSGKLNIVIQQYNSMTNSWTTLSDKSVLNYPITVKANGGIVKLDAIFNSKKISLLQAGKYRVVANFVSSRGTNAESNWEFDVV
ncbi:hypothetical protein HYW75_04400 [Candidatus Pacearchaeota archaeon]|nr:hypothetical protein [Candidatus Pacearchaeota archaeon]